MICFPFSYVSQRNGQLVNIRNELVFARAIAFAVALNTRPPAMILFHIRFKGLPDLPLLIAYS
jgi:hypothetical protein